MKSNPFSFGIYPGGQLGTPAGMSSGPPDNAAQILTALDDLQHGRSLLLVRTYIIYKGKGIPFSYSNENPKQFAVNGRKLDLVLCFQSPETDMEGWKNFVRLIIQEYYPFLGKIQITEEANVNLPVLDGYYPASRLALTEGICLARLELDKMGMTIPVGFNATPDFNPNKTFWNEIASLANKSFYESLGYVGLDFFPDVFRPLPGADDEKILGDAIKYIITMYRNDMGKAGIQSGTPIHITENGWPTGEERTEEMQANRIEKIIRIIYKLKEELNITHYEYFSLRDADTKVSDIFYRFGIMTDEYKPKKAFYVYKKLIHEFGAES